jgi:hypothetical protein
MKAVREYDARADSKNRITLREAKFKYYHVTELANDCYVLEPRELMPQGGISADTLKDMDTAVANLKAGKVSVPIDLSDLLPLTESEAETASTQQP